MYERLNKIGTWASIFWLGFMHVLWPFSGYHYYLIRLSELSLSKLITSHLKGLKKTDYIQICSCPCLQCNKSPTINADKTPLHFSQDWDCKMSSLPALLLFFLCGSLPTTLALPSTERHFKWEVEYIYWSPDCVENMMIGINGRFPGPTIRARVGDTIVVELKNSLPTEGVVIHWHGIRQVTDINDWAILATIGRSFL